MTKRRLLDPKNTVRIQLKPPLCVMFCLGALILPFLVFVLSGSRPYAEAFGLDLAHLPHEPWRLVTSLFWFGSPDRVEVVQVLGAVTGIWVFGPPLERWWGPWRLWVLVSAGGILGNLAAATASYLWSQDAMVGGPGTAAMGPAVAATTVFLNSWFLLPTRGRTNNVMGLAGKHIAIFLGAVMALGLLVDLFSGRSPARYAGYGVSALIAVLLITESWRPWVLIRRRRIKRLAKDSKVILFEKHLHRQDPKHWN